MKKSKKLFKKLFIIFLSPILLSYQSDLPFSSSFKTHPLQEQHDEIIQVGLTLANGYTGETSVTITEDSFHFKSNPNKVKFDTLTSKELWEEINNLSSIDDISKIPNGNTNQDRDGTDTICYIRTKFKKYYSFTNGHGDKFEKQQKFVSLLLRELFLTLLKSLK